MVRTLHSSHAAGLGAPYVRQYIKGHYCKKNLTALGSSWDTKPALLWD